MISFVLREPADLARHAQRLVSEHKRLQSKGGIGTRDMMKGLGDAFVKKTDPDFNKRVTPKIVTRVFYQYSSARITHTALFERLMDIAVSIITDFRPQELHDTVKAISYVNWIPGMSKVIALEKALINRSEGFSFQQASEILFSLSHLRVGDPKLYASLGKQLRNLYPLVGAHITPRDIGSTLRAFATMMQTDKKLFDMLTVRISHPDVCNSLSIHQGSRILWSFTMLSRKDHEVMNLLSQRCLTLAKSSNSIRSMSISPLMWSAATIGDKNELIIEACRCCCVNELNAWRCSSMLWSLAHSDINIRDTHNPHLMIFVNQLCERLSEINSYTNSTCATIAWSLSSLRYKHTKIFSDMHSFLKESEWSQFSKYSDEALMDLVVSFAEVFFILWI